MSEVSPQAQVFLDLVELNVTDTMFVYQDVEGDEQELQWFTTWPYGKDASKLEDVEHRFCEDECGDEEVVTLSYDEMAKAVWDPEKNAFRVDWSRSEETLDDAFVSNGSLYFKFGNWLPYVMLSSLVSHKKMLQSIAG